MIGTRIGRYELVREHARGRSGPIYVARGALGGGELALKLLPGQPPWNATTLALDHPGLVAVHDRGLGPDGIPFLVMELVPGESLATRRVRGGRWTIAQALAIAAQLANAVASAHRAGVGHGAITAAKIVFAPDPEHGERAKVLGVGMTERVDSGADAYAIGRILADLLGPRALPPPVAEALAIMLDADPQRRFRSMTMCARTLDQLSHARHDFPD